MCTGTAFESLRADIFVELIILYIKYLNCTVEHIRYEHENTFIFENKHTLYNSRETHPTLMKLKRARTSFDITWFFNVISI